MTVGKRFVRSGAVGVPAAVAAMLVMAGGSGAAAQPAGAGGGEEEARACFERGLLLMENENWEAALVEFGRSFELQPRRSSLFNIGMCQKALFRYGAAARTFRRWQTQFGATAGEAEQASVAAALAEMESLLGAVEVTVSEAGAEVRVDDQPVGVSPLAGPVEVSVGPHRIEAVREGYRTARAEVSVASGRRASVALVLEAGRDAPAPEAAGTIRVRTELPDVRVEIDGVPADLSARVEAGRRRVRVTRPGYLPLETEVLVEAGGVSEVTTALGVDPNLGASESGRVRVEIDREGGDVRLDGGPLPALAGAGVTIPAGAHDLEIVRDGYRPWRRRVEVPAGSEQTVRALLWPTPETMEAYEQSARSWSTAGWVTFGVGLAVAAGGGGMLGGGGAVRDDLQGDIDRWCVRVGAAAGCDPWGDQSGFTALYPGAYDDRNLLAGDGDLADGLTLGGWILVGVGAAAAVTGVVLLLTGDDPDYYREQEDVGITSAGLGPWAGGAVLTLGGRF